VRIVVVETQGKPAAAFAGFEITFLFCIHIVKPISQQLYLEICRRL